MPGPSKTAAHCDSPMPGPFKTADFREMVSRKHVDSPMPGPSKTAAAHCERKKKKDDG